MGNIRLYGSSSGYVEIAPPATGGGQVLTLPTDSVQPGLMLISSQSFVAASSASFNNVFSSSYLNYRVLFSLTSISATGNIYIRARYSGSDTTTSTYNYTQGRTGRASLSDAGGSTGVTYLAPLYAATGYQVHGNFDIFQGGISGGFQFIGNSWAYDSGYINYTASGNCTQATAHDGFSILPASGTITGSVRVYGYRN